MLLFFDPCTFPFLFILTTIWPAFCVLGNGEVASLTLNLMNFSKEPSEKAIFQEVLFDLQRNWDMGTLKNARCQTLRDLQVSWCGATELEINHDG